ncbi:MAG: sensor histidine kinase [Egibacteraceae bacterium]
MSDFVEGLRALPSAARWLILATSTAAVALATAAVLSASRSPTLAATVAVATGITVGEAFRLFLPYRRGGSVRFTLSDAALVGALILAPAGDVVLGVVVGTWIWQRIDRVPIVKVVFNCAQYLVGASAAALLVQALAPDPSRLDGRVALAVTGALVVFALVNSLIVSGVLAAVSGERFVSVGRRMLATNVIVLAGNGSLAVAAVALAQHAVWALPALIAPLLLVYGSSRQRLKLQLEGERADAFLRLEQRLGEIQECNAIPTVLIEEAASVLHWQAAVFSEGSWHGAVPEGSKACPVDPGLTNALVSEGALGPAVDGPCAAIGLGRGVLVAWSGALALNDEALRWLERIGASTRTHVARCDAHEALVRERATLRGVVDGTRDGVLVTDAEGRVQEWNPALTELVGLPPGAVLDREVSAVLGSGPWRREGLHEVLRPAPTGAQERVWRVAVARIEDPEAGALHVAAIHDISEERRAARMKDDMLAVVSHELRTPLTPIKASAQLLARRWKRLDESRRQRLLDTIEERSDHLTRLVEDLLLVAQLSSEAAARPRVVPARVDVAELLATDLPQLVDDASDHELIYEGPRSLPALTDRLRLRQIVGNLVDNACKFSPLGSTVWVTLAEDEGEAVIRVSDHGRGIPREDLERIFERFERVEDPLVMSTSGAGMGLYIVKALVGALDGQISIDSVLGVGTTVLVRLPLRVPEPRTVRDDEAMVYVPR